MARFGVVLFAALVGCTAGSARVQHAGPPPKPADPPPIECDQLIGPAGQSCVAAVTADLDGDGLPDHFALFRRPAGRNVYARAYLTGSRILEISFEAGGDPDALGIELVADADGDGGKEVFARLDQGASTTFVAVLSVTVRGRHERSLVWVTDQRGERVSLPINGSVRHGGGAECVDVDGDGRLEFLVLSAISDDGIGYEWEEGVYRWEGKRLISKAVRNGVTRRESDVARFYRLTCGGMTTNL
jgi:hypothetical protein